MALAQTREVIAQLKASDNSVEAELVKFSPAGDRDQVSRLETHGGKGGAFVGEIRDAMRQGRLEAAMHSLKDMPGDEEAPGLVIGAMLKREAAEDALVLRPDHSLEDFLATRAAGLKIGTNSVRRAAYLRRAYPEAHIIHFRGAADTRLRKLDEKTPQKLPGGGEVGPADALVVAKSGLERVGLGARVAKVFSHDEMLPAVGQGVVAVECAANDWATRAALAKIDHAKTRFRSEAEREMLWVLNGHCNAPIAGHAALEGDTLFLSGAVISEDGRQIIEVSHQGPADRPRELGRAAGLALLNKGAATLIEAARR